LFFTAELTKEEQELLAEIRQKKMQLLLEIQVCVCLCTKQKGEYHFRTMAFSAFTATND